MIKNLLGKMLLVVATAAVLWAAAAWNAQWNMLQ